MEETKCDKTIKPSILIWLKSTLLNVFVVAFLLLTLAAGLLINLLQLINFLMVKPCSIDLYRIINRYFHYAIVSHLVVYYEWWAGAKLTIYFPDDKFEEHFINEHKLGLSNHRYQLDPIILLNMASHYRCLDNGKGFVKKTLGYIPVLGWSMFFSEWFFLDRKQSDIESIESNFERLKDDDRYLAVFMAPEGTRFTEEKRKASVEFAKSRGLKTYKHHLVPRIKGPTTAIRCLKVDFPNSSVYNVEWVVKELSKDSLSGMFKGFASDVDIYFKRFPIEQIPTESDAKIADFLYDLYEEKDLLFEYHKNYGKFPGFPMVMQKKWAPLIAVIVCQLFVTPRLIYFLWLIFSSGQYLQIGVTLAVMTLAYVSLQLLFAQVEKQSEYGLKNADKR